MGLFYRRKQRQIGRHKAVVALARKLLIVAWRLLLTGEAYWAHKPALLVQKQRQLEDCLHAAVNWDTVLEDLYALRRSRGSAA